LVVVANDPSPFPKCGLGFEDTGKNILSEKSVLLQKKPVTTVEAVYQQVGLGSCRSCILFYIIFFCF